MRSYGCLDMFSKWKPRWVNDLIHIHMIYKCTQIIGSGGVQKVYLPCLTNIFRFFQLHNHSKLPGWPVFLQDDVSLASAAAEQWAITFSRDRLLLWCLVCIKAKSIGIPLLPMELTVYLVSQLAFSLERSETSSETFVK